jgi:hypothetical protein
MRGKERGAKGGVGESKGGKGRGGRDKEKGGRPARGREHSTKTQRSMNQLADLAEALPHWGKRLAISCGQAASSAQGLRIVGGATMIRITSKL